MRTLFLFFIILSFTIHSYGGNMQLDYKLSWKQPNAHYFDITIHVTGSPRKTTSFRIPAWRPGRYVMQNFTKNIVGVTAETESGAVLELHQTDKDTWQVQNGNYNDFCLRYKAYAFELDAGNSFLDDSEAYINPATMMMYVPGRETDPLSLKIEKPASWKIALPLDIANDGRYHVSDYHTLIDSPILISPDFKTYRFSYAGATIELAIQGDGVYRPDSLIADVRKIVTTEAALFGGLPFKRYVFIYHFMSRPFSHGVEHKDATSIVVGPADFSVKRNYNRFLGVTAHEFFHVWNVERIRPESIYLPDYSREEYSQLMWFFEGVTSYYDDLTLCRAGLLKPKAYHKVLAGNICRFQQNPGHKITSPAMASFQSWGKYNGAPPYSNVSFYTSGAVLGLLLDLEIRALTGNKKSLDTVMRYLYKNYAQKDRGVGENDIRLAIEQVSGHSFKAFFADYVQGTKDIDFDRFLDHAGLTLTKEPDPDKASAYLGLSVEGVYNRVIRMLPGSPAFEAGLDMNDELIAIDGRKIDEGMLPQLLKQYSPGDVLTVTCFHHAKLKTRKVTLGDGHIKNWKVKALQDKNTLQKAIYRDWLKIR